MGITDYFTHVGISFLLAIIYLAIQYDYNKKFQNQRDLLYMSGAVFVFSFFICFIVVKIPRKVTFGDNKIQEFQDEEEEEEEEVEEEEYQPSEITSAPFPNIPTAPETPSIPPLPVS